MVLHAFSSSRTERMLGDAAAEFYGHDAPSLDADDLDDEDEEDAEELQREFYDSSSTFYLGSRKSASQVCIYQKREDIVRIEFVLRRAFLRKQQFNQPADILQLSTFDLSERLRFREFHPDRFQEPRHAEYR